MAHSGTDDFAPHTAVLDSDDQVFATVDEFRHDSLIGVGTRSWCGAASSASSR
ncbi:hypothetical protein GS931_21605 [Rhodococcus hoagii]|nr:hypothetical protein [Prescottella equi]